MDKQKEDIEVAAASMAPGSSSQASPTTTPPKSSSGMGEEVYFIARKELNFGPNHAHTALLLADVDGDGQQELVVGSLDGKVAVYKGLERKEPWAVSESGLGMLRVFATGHVWPWLQATKRPPRPSAAMTATATTASTEEDSREVEAEEAEAPREPPPQLIAVTVEGDLHVFDFRDAPASSSSSSSFSTKPPGVDSEQQASQPTNLKENKGTPSRPPMQQSPPWKLVPSQTLSVEPNVTAALVLDVDGDGIPELLLGRMDGTVQVFAWRPPPRPMSPRSPEQDEEEEEEHQDQSQRYAPSEPEFREKSAGQVSSSVVSLSAVHGEGPNGSSLCVVAGLETGTVEVLRCFSSYKDNGEAPLSSLVDLGIGGGLPLPLCGWSGPLTCCFLRGGAQRGTTGGFAVAGLDGRLAMGVVEQQQQQVASDEDLVWKTVWSLQTTQPLYAVAPFRIGDAPAGESGFAACGWSGLTCMVNATVTNTGAGAEAYTEGQAKVDVLVFDPSKMLVPPLRGFVAGRFGERNEPCLFYSCADGHILVFHDLERQLKQCREPSLDSEDEVAAAVRQLRSGEAQKLVKAWVDLHLASATGEAGLEAEEGSSGTRTKGSTVDERQGEPPPSSAAPAEGKKK